jgi:fibronectin type 3 domain-containing protein
MKTVGYSAPANGNLTYDVNGWPTSDIGATTIIDARHNMAWDGPDWVGVNPVVAGTYHLSFTGQATITVNTEIGTSIGVSVQNQVYNAESNQTTAELVLQPGYFLFQLALTNTKRQPTDTPGTGFTDARLIPPGYDPDTTDVFTKATLQAYQIPIAANRVPDGMNDYCSTYPDSLGNCFIDAAGDFAPAKWADRVLVTDAFQGGLPAKNMNGHTSHGQAWEYIIMFANATHHDLWINVPVNADDDYVTQLATLLKNGNAYTPGLDRDLHIYVEYANEVWNPGYNNYTINSVYAQQQQGFNPNDPDFYYTELPEQYVLRTIQIAKIFENVWGKDAINNQIRPVALWQYTNETTFQRVFEWVEAKINEPVKKYLYGVGQAAYYNPYYNINVPQPGNPGNTYPLEYPNASSVDNLFNVMWTGSDQVRRDFIGWKAVAAYFGLKEVAYEGGPSLMDGVGATAARDPRITLSEVHHFLDNWFAIGGDVVNYTSMRGGIGAGLSGSWFLLEYYDHPDTPRMRGAVDILNSPQPALTAGHVLPWKPGQEVGIDPSQRVPDPWSNENTPGSGLDQGIHSWDGLYDEALYLLRATGGGTFNIWLYGDADDTTVQEQIKVDDKLLGTVTFPVGTPEWSTPVSVNLTSGFHTLLLTPTGGTDGAQVHFPAGSGVIQIARVTGFGESIVPAAPTNVTTTAASGQVTVQWAPQTTAQRYTVKRGTHSGGPYKTVGTTTDTTYIDLVENGKPYYYVITALNAAGESALSAQIPGEATPTEAPSAPSGLTAQAAAGDGAFLGGGEALLSWSPVPGAVAYNIYSSSTNGGFTPGSPYWTVLGTQFLDAGEAFSWLGGPNPPGTTYYYAVSAVNTYGEGPLSAQVSVNPVENVPPTPTGLVAKAEGNHVFLSWNPVFGMTPSFGPQYNVKRSTTSGGPYVTISSIASPNFIDIAVADGKKYYYVVSAVKSVGESPNSSEVSAEIQ